MLNVRVIQSCCTKQASSQACKSNQMIKLCMMAYCCQRFSETFFVSVIYIFMQNNWWNRQPADNARADCTRCSFFFVYCLGHSLPWSAWRCAKLNSLVEQQHSSCFNGSINLFNSTSASWAGSQPLISNCCFRFHFRLPVNWSHFALMIFGPHERLNRSHLMQSVSQYSGQGLAIQCLVLAQMSATLQGSTAKYCPGLSCSAWQVAILLCRSQVPVHSTEQLRGR